MAAVVAHGHDFTTATSLSPTAAMATLCAGLQSCSLGDATQQQQQQHQGFDVEDSGVAPCDNDDDEVGGQSLGGLPDEVLLVVASHLDVRALGAFAQVDRRIRAIAEDDALWREMFGARFGFRPTTAPASWKQAYCDYEATPLWHPTQKHPELIIKDDGLTATMPTPTGNGNDNTDNRTIRATVEYSPGSGLHYFEVQSLCPNDVMYHPYVGICSTKEAVPVEKMLMWLSEQCYAYGGNGTLYSSGTLEGNYKHLGKYQYGDKIGVMVDYREKGQQGWLTFYLNKNAVSHRMRITGTWFPCVGMFHPRHALQIVVRPQVPTPEGEEVKELALPDPVTVGEEGKALADA